MKLNAPSGPAATMVGVAPPKMLVAFSVSCAFGTGLLPPSRTTPEIVPVPRNVMFEVTVWPAGTSTLDRPRLPPAPRASRTYEPCVTTGNS